MNTTSQEKGKLIEENGILIKNKSKELKIFEKSFFIKDMSAFDGIISGVYFESEQWEGDFIPKSKYDYPWECNLVFPIEKDSSLIVGLIPENLIEAYKDFISNKFIKEFLNNSSNINIRIRAAGDRLHWDSDEVKNYYEILRSKGYEVGDFKKWIEVIVDFDKKEMISFYRPLHSNFYLVQLLTNYPKIWSNKFDHIAGKELFSKYCWNNCTVFSNDGSLKLYRIR